MIKLTLFIITRLGYNKSSFKIEKDLIMKNTQSKILTVQDLSCVGQCSLTVALPILSAYGLETAVLPTAILSEHTMFKHFTFLDLAENMEKTFASWQAEGHTFGSVYTGYLGRKEHFRIVGNIIERCLESNGEVFVDPAFGDNGKLYYGFDEEYVRGMSEFIKYADVILPNITEACYLLGIAYRDNFSHDELKEVIKNLSLLGDTSVVLTGVTEGTKIGFASYDKKTGETKFYVREKIGGAYHGTGDIFASAFTGAYLNGKSLYDAAIDAAEFVASSIENTEKGHDYGVRFERVIVKR